MNPLPAPVVPGKTESERFQNALHKVFDAPKTAARKTEAVIPVEVVPLAAIPEPILKRAKGVKKAHPAR